MSDALEHVRYSCGIAGEEVANYVDQLQAKVAELEAENARLNLLFVKAAKGKGENLKECFSLQQQLAAVQEEMNEWRNQAHQSQSAFDRLQYQLAKAEQRVAEACALQVATETRFHRLDAARVAKEIRSGEYRKFMKEM